MRWFAPSPPARHTHAPAHPAQHTLRRDYACASAPRPTPPCRECACALRGAMGAGPKLRCPQGAPPAGRVGYTRGGGTDIRTRGDTDTYVGTGTARPSTHGHLRQPPPPGHTDRVLHSHTGTDRQTRWERGTDTCTDTQTLPDTQTLLDTRTCTRAQRVPGPHLCQPLPGQMDMAQAGTDRQTRGGQGTWTHAWTHGHLRTHGHLWTRTHMRTQSLPGLDLCQTPSGQMDTAHAGTDRHTWGVGVTDTRMDTRTHAWAHGHWWTQTHMGTGTAQPSPDRQTRPMQRQTDGHMMGGRRERTHPWTHRHIRGHRECPATPRTDGHGPRRDRQTDTLPPHQRPAQAPFPNQSFIWKELRPLPDTAGPGGGRTDRQTDRSLPPAPHPPLQHPGDTGTPSSLRRPVPTVPKPPRDRGGYRDAVRGYGGCLSPSHGNGFSRSRVRGTHPTAFSGGDLGGLPSFFETERAMKILGRERRTAPTAQQRPGVHLPTPKKTPPPSKPFRFPGQERRDSRQPGLKNIHKGISQLSWMAEKRKSCSRSRRGENRRDLGPSLLRSDQTSAAVAEETKQHLQ